MKKLSIFLLLALSTLSFGQIFPKYSRQILQNDVAKTTFTVMYSSVMYVTEKLYWPDGGYSTSTPGGSSGTSPWSRSGSVISPAVVDDSVKVLGSRMTGPSLDSTPQVLIGPKAITTWKLMHSGGSNFTTDGHYFTIQGPGYGGAGGVSGFLKIFGGDSDADKDGYGGSVYIRAGHGSGAYITNNGSLNIGYDGPGAAMTNATTNIAGETLNLDGNTSLDIYGHAGMTLRTAATAVITLYSGSDSWSVPKSRGTTGMVLTTDGVGGSTWAVAGGSVDPGVYLTNPATATINASYGVSVTSLTFANGSSISGIPWQFELGSGGQVSFSTSTFSPFPGMTHTFNRDSTMKHLGAYIVNKSTVSHVTFQVALSTTGNTAEYYYPVPDGITVAVNLSTTTVVDCAIAIPAGSIMSVHISSVPGTGTLPSGWAVCPDGD